jgi:hypothetical protein
VSGLTIAGLPVHDVCTNHLLLDVCEGTHGELAAALVQRLAAVEAELAEAELEIYDTQELVSSCHAAGIFTAEDLNDALPDDEDDKP